MFPLFGNEKKRPINLGGASSVSSHSDILGQARAQRNERLEQKLRHDSAVRVQAWWRGTRDAKEARIRMRNMFDGDVAGIVGLRSLALIGRNDEEALAIWSKSIVDGGPDLLFAVPQSGLPELQQSWLVLLRQICVLLIRSVANAPLSPHAIYHLKILNSLLVPKTTTEHLGESGPRVSTEIMQYLLLCDFYPTLSRAIRGIPLESRSSPSLALLIPLATLPFQNFSASAPEYALSITALFSILTIPLLPNRLSPQTLIHLSAQIPFSQLHLLDLASLADSTTIEDKLHLIATLQILVPPRYKLLPTPALSTYLRLLTALLNAVPISILNPSLPKLTTTGPTTAGSDSDSDSHQTRVTVVDSFSSPNANPSTRPITRPDSKTSKRIATLPTPTHLAALLACTRTALPSLLPLLNALIAIWPNVPSSVLAAAPDLVRELYRGHVRGSVLGREDAPVGALKDPVNADAWAPLLVLVELYTTAMRTMADDEFFGTGAAVEPSYSSRGKNTHTLATAAASATSTSAPLFVLPGGMGRGGASAARNPLTLDELRSFSRQLLNIAFSLYWREGVERGLVGCVRYTWEDVREKVTKCLIAIHARDSRKPFVPQGHWLVTSQIDVQSFVEAAIFEEHQLSSSSTSTSTPLPSRNSRIRSAPTYSKRQLAYLSPRLGILNNIPFAIPFDTRVSIFRNFILNDIRSRSGFSSSLSVPLNLFAAMRQYHPGMERTRVQVRRGSVAQDGFDRLAEADLKAPIEITFIDQFGSEEAGIDGGGVFKEFFTSLCKEVFDTDRGLWLANKENELYPNPHAYATEPHSLNWYRFIGRILGKAMYEGILVDVAFAGFFLVKWLGRQSFLDDLASLDPDLYNGLVFLKHYTGNTEDLALNFTVAIDEFGETRTLDLIPDGSNVAVTRENRLQYIQLVSHYRLSRQIKLQSEAFFDGLSEMIDTKWIRMFNQQEIQILIGGVNTPIDLDDLRRHTNYGGIYDDKQETIVAFWNVVGSFNQEQRMAFLRFVTSCSRPPLLGCKELVPNFSIRDAGTDEHRLPTSSTCVNLLKLPQYKSEKVLRSKLLQAIMSNAGFDLS